MTPAIIDWDALLTVVWASLAAGIGVTAAFGFAILGATRALEFGRDGRMAEAGLFGIVGAAGIAIVIAAIVFGILVIA
jgi:hypothetical protein